MVKNTKRSKIIGTGSYLPKKILTNADMEKIIDTTDEWITVRSGIKERRVGTPEEVTSDLALEASRKALKNAGITKDDIDLIIVATATPDTAFPSTACWLQKKLKADHIPAFDITAGCSGFVYGLIIADSMIQAGTAKRILLVGAEMLTRITNWTDRGSCFLFGDAAGAVVLEMSDNESGILSHYWKADGNLGELLYQPAGGTRMQASAETVANHLHTINMSGNEVFKHAVKRMGEAAVEALKMAGLKNEDVDYLIPHQANIRIMEATGRRIKIAPEKVYSNIHKYGNTSAATIPVALDELNAAKQLEKGNNIVMVAFGAGFTWASVAYRW